MHKGFKCLDVATGRIYISRNVIFDESIFPFASMDPNVGAKYHSDVLLQSHGNSASANKDYVTPGLSNKLSAPTCTPQYIHEVTSSMVINI
jgi:hypothetical protein